jgi:hypothetical protein
MELQRQILTIPHGGSLPDSMSWDARLETLEGHQGILLRGPVVEGPSGSFYFTGDRKVYRASPLTLE